VTLDFQVKGTDIKWIAWGTTLFAGLTMVSNLPYYSGKEINLRKSVPFVTILLLALFFFVLIPSQPPVVLFSLFLLYVLSGYVVWVWRMVKKRKNIKAPIA
jgi:CDP-diacylglycerol--serine O-phosphatidyltransferase